MDHSLLQHSGLLLQVNKEDEEEVEEKDSSGVLEIKDMDKL